MGVKSIRGVRRDCVNKLAIIIEELLKRLGSLQAPPNPEQLMQDMETRLQQIKQEAHEIIENEFNRVSELLRVRINETSTSLKGMGEIHSRLETIIEQLKDTHSVLCEGKKTNINNVP